LRPYLEQSLLDVLYPKPDASSPLNETAYTQPALFALEYALAELWRSWGIEPEAVMGHSVGEYVAACVAGIFDLEDGLKLIAERGRLMQSLPRDGEMAAVFTDEAHVRAVIQPYVHEVSIAAVNGPEHIVIAGTSGAVQTVITRLQGEGIKTTALTVSHAFHSPLMEPILDAFERVAQTVPFATPAIPLVSNVTGELATSECMTPTYWRRHIRQSIRFADSMKTLHQQGYRVFLEIGPQPTLSGMGRHCLPETETEAVPLWLSSLRRGQSSWQHLLQSLGALYTLGCPVDWAGFDRDYVRRRLPLPTYPFQRQRHWVDPAAVGVQQPVLAPGVHPLVGQRLRLPLSQEIRFESRYNRSVPPYVEDHRIFGVLVVAGASHVAMLLLAVEEAFSTRTFVLDELFFLQPLVLSEEGQRTAQLVFVPRGAGDASFQFLSLQEGADASDPASWITHVTGNVQMSIDEPSTAAASLDVSAVQSRCTRQMSGVEFYTRFWIQGDDAGPSFRWIRTLWQGEGEALAQTGLPPIAEDVCTYQLHPGIIEACFQVMRGCREFESAELLTKTGDLYVPFSIASFRFYRRPQSDQLWCYALIRDAEQTHDQSVVGDLQLYDENGELIVDICGFEVRKFRRETLLRNLRKDTEDWLYQIVWQPKEVIDQTPPSSGDAVEPWLIFADQTATGYEPAAQLRERGAQCTLIFPDQAYQYGDDGHYAINPADPDDFRRLFQDLTASEKVDRHGQDVTYRGIVYMWGGDGAPESTTLTTLQEAQVLGCEGALHLAQALAQVSWAVPPRLWLVTRGTQAVGMQLPLLNIQHAPLWGLGQVVRLEHPEFQCSCLDLDPAAASEAVRVLRDELLASGRNDHVAYRQGIRYVARLARYCPAPGDRGSQTIAVDSQSSYLITGGLGALGLQVAQWLVEQGARHLALTGRRGAVGSVAAERVRQLEQAGAEVHVISADIAQPNDVTQVLETMASSMPPLRGIVHAAGVLDDGLLLRQNVERFRSVMAPKMAGAWNLHAATQSLPLDLFICFSSATSLLGAPGQGNYAAANAFMDALAHYRRAQGLAALSINWGPWAEVGMAAQLGRRERQRMMEQGWEVIAPEEGRQVLGRLLRQPLPQVGVLPVNWSKFLASLPLEAAPSLVADLACPEASNRRTEQHRPTRQGLLQHLQEASVNARQELLAAYVEEEVANLLGLSPGQEAIPHQQGFAEIGMDSLMGVVLRARLQEDLGIALSTTFAFDYSNIIDVTAYLLERLKFDSPTPSTTTASAFVSRPVAEVPEELLEAVSDLSAGTLDASIEEELAKLEASLKNDRGKSN
jgi:acyl transferase domain-containing protein